MMTVAKRIKVTNTWGSSFSKIISIKKTITPKLTNQKPIFFSHRIAFPLSDIMENKSDIVIRESGKENPKKNVSS